MRQQSNFVAQKEKIAYNEGVSNGAIFFGSFQISNQRRPAYVRPSSSTTTRTCTVSFDKPSFRMPQRAEALSLLRAFLYPKGAADAEGLFSREWLAGQACPAFLKSRKGMPMRKPAGLTHKQAIPVPCSSTYILLRRYQWLHRRKKPPDKRFAE